MLKRFDYERKTPFARTRKNIGTFWARFKQVIIATLVIAGLMISPLVVEHMREASKRRFNETFFEWLPEHEKWNEVQLGRAHIECDKDAAQALHERGQDPNQLAGIEFAIKDNICRFVMN